MRNLLYSERPKFYKKLETIMTFLSAVGIKAGAFKSEGKSYLLQVRQIQ